MPSTRIRPAQAADLPHIRRLLQELHGVPPWDDDQNFDAESVYNRILGDPHRRLFIADVDGKSVGMLDTIIVPNLTRNIRPWAGIENIVVAREMRRHGIGRSLMQAALDYARHCGCYKVQLVSASRRRDAHALYRATGFDADVQGYRRYLVDTPLAGED
jgi:GNAT superfamily N-acetyltransferase